MKSPFTLLDIDGRFDVTLVSMAAASPARPALRQAPLAQLNEIDRDDEPPRTEEGWLP